MRRGSHVPNRERHDWRAPWYLCALILVNVIALAACGGAEPADGSGGPAPEEEPPIASSPLPEEESPVASSPDAGCSFTHPHGLSLMPETQEEIEYLDEINACTDEDGTSTLIRNNSDAVWTIETSVGGEEVQQLTSTHRLESFREIAGQVYRYSVLSPDSELVVYAPPGEVSWELAPELSAMWMIHDEIVDTVEGYGQDQLSDLLTSGQSPRRKALVTCAVSTYEIANEDLGGLASDQPASQLLTALGVGTAVTDCKRSWQNADDVARQRYSSVPTWGDEIALLADDTRFLNYADDHLSLLQRLGKALVQAR